VTLLSIMPIATCRTCAGVGTIQVPRAGARTKEEMDKLGWPEWRQLVESPTFTQICSRCGGGGTVIRHLVDHPETKS
jgi:hypothetical protein